MSSIDWNVLGDLPKTYKDARKADLQERTLADLGKMIQSGNVDYNQVAGSLAQLGQFGPSMSALQVGRQRSADAGVGTLLQDVFGGAQPGAQTQAAAPPGNPARAVTAAPRPSNAPPISMGPAADDPTMTVSPRQVQMANAGQDVSPAAAVAQRFPAQAGVPMPAPQAPAPQAQAGGAQPQFSPQAIRVIQAMNNPDLSPASRQSLQTVLTRLMPADNKIMSLPDGTILSVNERTNQATPIYQGARPQFTKIGQNPDGNDQYGFVDPTRQTVTPAPGSNAAPTNPFSSGKQTEGQANASLYASRMFDAEKVLRDPKVIEIALSLPQRGLAGVPVIGNYLQTPDYQKFDQAQRNFINAVLRRESGAVISDAEFQNARLQYFPQPGDKPPKLQEKMRNRATAIRGIAGAAGPGWRPPYVFNEQGSMVENPGPQREQPASAQPQQQGQPTQAPQAGAIVGGFRFRGGNPNDQNSWEPAQ